MGKGRLKAALARHEQRSAVVKAQEAKVLKRTAMEKLQKDKRRRQSAGAQPGQAKWVPIDPESTVCLIGEGDFSFATALLDNALAGRVIATGLDSEAQVQDKYGNDHLEHLRSLYEDDATILHNVDAKHLAQCKPLVRALQPVDDQRSLVFMFNFPHLGNSISDQDRNIRQHQELVLEFFRQTYKGWPQARVVLTLFDGQPYESWEIKRLARVAGYRLERSGRFAWDAYPGYQHQLTSKGGASTSKRQMERPARSYMFAVSTETDDASTSTTNTKKPAKKSAKNSTKKQSTQQNDSDSEDDGASRREKPKKSTQVVFD